MSTHTNVTLGPPSASRTRTVLVADESDQVRAVVTDNLTADGYRVRSADSRERAFEILTTDRVDVIVVDVNGDTLGLIEEIRAHDGTQVGLDRNVAMIALTAKATDAVHRVRLLDRGADDVIGKPFSYPELRARIEALLRRAGRRESLQVVEVGGLSIDPVARTVRVDGELVELTRRERDLLRTLATEPTRVFTRAELLRALWDTYTASRTLDTCAWRLRKKLTAAGADGLIQTVWGVGYRLTDA